MSPTVALFGPFDLRHWSVPTQGPVLATSKAEIRVRNMDSRKEDKRKNS